MFKLYRADKDDESTYKIPILSIERGLLWFEEELGKRGSTFFGGSYKFSSSICCYGIKNVLQLCVPLSLNTGDKPGMLDYMIWPWFERIPALPLTSEGVVKVALNKFPKLVNILHCNKPYERS